MLEMKLTAYTHIICPCLYFQNAPHTQFILIALLHLSHNNIGVDTSLAVFIPFNVYVLFHFARCYLL